MTTSLAHSAFAASAVRFRLLVTVGFALHLVCDAQVLNQTSPPPASPKAAHAAWMKALIKASGADWCPMQRRPLRKAAGIAPDSCPIEGQSDVPAIRDAHIPNASTPIKTIRLKINVFDYHGYRTQADVDAQVALLNADFLPWRIQFVAETEFIFQYEQPVLLRDSDALKPLFADRPDSRLNIYVLNPQDFDLLIGYSYFPFWPDALGPSGGIVMHASLFGEGGLLLTHEVGHSFGLYHTFTGVSEVEEACSACYERADGLNADTTGDFCSDTPSTPRNFSCAPPGGTDPCSSTLWGPTMVDNHMSYGSCDSFRFTPQQAGRMHSWIEERLSGWLLFNLDVSLSAAPEPAIVGSNLTYTLTVSNYGGSAASDVIFTDVLPAGVILASVSSNVSWSVVSNRVAVTFQTIPAGSAESATVTVIPFQAGIFTNEVIFQADLRVGGVTTNRTSIAGTVISNPAATDSILAVSDVTVIEGNSGSVNALFAVNLSPPSSSPVTVVFNTTNGSAQAGVDYNATNGTFTFAPGETKKLIEAVVFGDTEREPNENFFVQISPVTNAFNARLSAEGTIVRDDFLIDFVVSRIEGPVHWSTGTPLAITNAIINTGSENIQTASTVGIYLSADTLITTNDRLVATRVVPRLSAGQTNLVILEPDGVSVAAGTYYLGAIADVNDSINELDESNNSLTGNSIEIVIGPDLVASSVEGPGRGNTLNPIEVTGQIINTGTGAAGKMTLGIYLSADSVITTNDLLLRSWVLSGLAADARNTSTFEVSLPPALPLGAYYLGLIVDELDEVIETREDNNVIASRPIEVVPGPDLLLTKVAGWSVVPSGSAFLATNVLRNVGLTDVPLNSAVRVGLYLSTDVTITTNDIFLGHTPGSDLPAGANRLYVATLFAPPTISPGNYYLGGIADYQNAVKEGNEANNALDGSRIEIVVGPDLAPASIGTPLLVVTAAPFVATNVIRNIGTGNSAPCSVGFYLSPQPIVTTNDLRVGERVLNVVFASSANSNNTAITIPPTVTPGTYHLAVIADDTNSLLEVNEANNTATTQIEIVAGPDLVVNDLKIPAQAATGLQIIITNAVSNVGHWTNASFVLRFFLSEDESITTNDFVLGHRIVPPLAPGQISAENTPRTVSYLPPGTYYLGAIADADLEIGETVETNNVAVRLIEIAAGPDLTIIALAGPSEATTISTITVTNTVVNVGQSTAYAVAVGYFLSTDPTITTNDIFLGERGLVLGPGENNSNNIVLAFPPGLTPRLYYLGAIADWRDRIAESSEANNARLAGALNVSLGADVEMAEVSAPAVVDRFSAFAVTNTVRNAGGENLGPIHVGFYLSPDSIVTTNDLKIGNRVIGTLPVGQTSSEATSVNITNYVSPGTYYIGALADDALAIAEVTETNNARFGNTVRIVSGPDLVVTSVTGPSRSPTWSFVTVTNVVMNAGTDPVASPFLVRTFLSVGDTVTNDDFVLGEVLVTNALAAGESLAVTKGYLIGPSQLLAGNYRLVTIVDAQRQIAELVEINNIFYGQPTEFVFGPDLVMTGLNVPSSATSGNPINVSSSIANIGEGTVQVYFDVGFYLSPDPVITTNDILIGFRALNYLPVGGSNSESTTVNISASIVAGTYYFGGIADDSNTIQEGNENNNTISAGTITIVAGPDLELSTLRTPSAANTLVPISVTNTVRNIGTGASIPFTLGFYLSDDPTITTNDLKLASRPVGELTAGSSNSTTTVFQFPLNVPSGIHYFGAIADESSAVQEVRKDNNISITTISIIGGPDLVVTEISGASSIMTGDSILVTNTVRNVGMSDVTSSFSVALYVSVDGTITTGDLQIGSRSLTGLAAGQSNTAITPVSMLTIMPRAYYFGAIVDHANVIAEISDANNGLTGATFRIQPIVIKDVHLEETDLVVTFSSAAGRIYRLERALGLSAEWQPVTGATDLIGTGADISTRHLAPSGPATSFYRIRLLE